MKDPTAPGSGHPWEVLPLITLRDMVVFPHSIRPFVVGRKNSITAVEAALGSDRKVFLSLQKDPLAEEPPASGLNRLGVVARVVQSLALANGHIKVLVEGLSRAVVKDFLLDGPVWHVTVEVLPEPDAMDVETEAITFEVARIFDEFSRKQQGLFGGVTASSLNIEDAGRFADQLASHLSIQTEPSRRSSRPCRPWIA